MFCLREKDYQDINSFFYRISHAKGDFRENVLLAVATIFGYQRVTFWIADSVNILVDPRFHNVEKTIINSYLDQYYQYDPFSYNNLNKQQRKNSVLTLPDVVNAKDYFQDNVYYREVLSQFSYNEKMVIHLKDGKNYLGGMSFLRNKNEKPFDARDRQICEVICNYVTFLLKMQHNFYEIQEENLMLKDIMELNSSGMIILNQDLNIVYINKAGETYLNRIYSLTAFRVEDIFNQFFYTKEYGGTQEVRPNNPAFMFEIGGINIQIGVVQNHGQSQYYILLSPKAGEVKKNFIKQEMPLSVVDSANANNKRASLTKRESQVVDLILDGCTNQEIANILFVSLSTVKTHIYQIYKKLEVNNRASLIVELSKNEDNQA